jgi:hypothetical protein
MLPKCNFIAFEFHDNDFHAPLRDAVLYVMENRSEDLTEEAFVHFVIKAMQAFDSIRRIDMFAYENRDYSKTREQYFAGKLTVHFVDHKSELKDNFEGYVVATNTNYLWFQSY